MAIQRIHFRERYTLPRDEEGIVRAIGRLLVGNTLDETIVESTILEPGIHNLTPEVWQKHNSNGRAYVVQVFDNGMGLYLQVPNNPRAVERVMKDGVFANVPGMDVTPLDGTVPFAAIMGGDPETPPSADVFAYLFELVNYQPDSSPTEQPGRESV